MSPAPVNARFGPPKLPSPVRGEQAPLATTVGGKQHAELVAEQKLKGVDLGDVDVFLAQRAGKTQKQGLMPSLQALLSGKEAPASHEAQSVQQSVQQAVGTLTAVYADGLVTEAEIAALSRAQSRLSSVLQLADKSVLQMLPRDVRERLETRLFEPLQVLVSAAGRRADRVMAEVAGRDEEALRERLLQPAQPSFTAVSLHAVATGTSPLPSSSSRYGVGDVIGVPRSDGGVSLGVVTGRDPDGLRVEVLDAHGHLGLKKLDETSVARANPFKIGDVIDVEGGRAWITGVGPHGKLEATVQDQRGVRRVGGAVPPSHPDHSWIDSVSKSFLDIVHAAPVKAVQSPSTTPVRSAVKVVAGGDETSTPETLKGTIAEAALFTYRGIGYKDYNEDAAVIGTAAGKDGKEIFFAGAFDQAGGMGGVPGQTGAASKAAAQRFQEAIAAIAQGSDAGVALQRAGQAAHDDVNSFGVGAATTFAGGVVVNGHAVVVNCGDSGVLLVDKHGRIKAATEAHNLGDSLAKQSGDPNAGLNVANVITSCLGGDAAPQLDVYRWPVEKGDRLVFVSDGVLDANLGAQKADFKAGKPWQETAGDVTARDIGRIVGGAASTQAASQGLIDYARAQVESGRGKRDNVTAVVVTLQ